MIAAIGARPAALGIIPLPDFETMLARIVDEYAIDWVAIGQGTNAAEITQCVERLGLPFTLVDERETTLLARARFFADHPPRGWKRLVPQGMLLPDRPIDDYAALLIAERYLRLAG